MDTCAASSTMPSPPPPYVSACGKVILLGEHAVVYGVPALAVGIERGVQARSTALTSGPSRLLVADWGLEVTTLDTDKDLGRALDALLKAAAVNGPVKVEAIVELPPGGGLGCSAALGVAVAKAVDPAASPDQLRERAMAWERVFHGNPSGVDAAVSASGGCIQFDRARGIERVATRPLFLCIGHSGIPSSTRAMVESLARLRARRPDMVEKAFEGVHSLVRNARLALEAGDVQGLGRLMDLNQMILSGLFLSSSEIEQMCGLARDAGALGAKLTGAGGGGCVVALVPGAQVAEEVRAAWQAAGFEGFVTRVAASPSLAPGSGARTDEPCEEARTSP